MLESNEYPFALDCPEEKITLITEDLINRVIDASRKSPRKRIILPFHKSPSDNLHRMLNAVQPMSYIRPHRHYSPPKAESVIVLKGAIVCIEFDNSGEISASHKIAAGSFNIGIDFEPNIFHTFFATDKDTVIFEVKPGPYKQASDKDFAPWAPAEGTSEAEIYLKDLYRIA